MRHLLSAGKRKRTYAPAEEKLSRDLMKQLHLVRITKEGDFETTQGFSEMPGVVKKETIELYIQRFDWQSKEIINKYLEKK